MANNKPTHKQYFTALIALVEKNPDFTVEADGKSANADEVVKFLEGRIESLEKKTSKASDKVNTEQAEVDEKVLSVMTPIGTKVAQIAKLVNEEYEVEYSSSKVTASLRRLVARKLVKNEVVKKDSLYSLADPSFADPSIAD